MLRNIPMSIAISIAALFVMASDPAFSRNASYEYVKNSEGQRIGVVYAYGTKGLVGELAIHRDTRHFLFVRCGTREKRWGQKYMKRYDRNCRRQLAPWPKNIVEFVQVEHGPVILDGPPETCGMCIELPFQMLELPDGVEVLPSDLDSILGEQGPPIRSPMTDPPFDPMFEDPVRPGNEGEYPFDPRIDTIPSYPGRLDDEYEFLFERFLFEPGTMLEGPGTMLEGTPVPGGAPPGGGMPGGGFGP